MGTPMYRALRRVPRAFAALLVLGSLGLGTSAALAQTQAPAAVAAAVPAPPAGDELTANADSSITITWPASAGATSYNLYRGTTAGGEGRVDGARAGEGGGEVAELEGDAAGRRPAGGPQGARDVSARGAVTQDAAAGGGLEDVGADGTDLPADSAGRANGGRRPQRRS